MAEGRPKQWPKRVGFIVVEKWQAWRGWHVARVRISACTPSLAGAMFGR